MPFYTYQEPAMDQKDEFSKWMKSIEVALSEEVNVSETISVQSECGCGEWNCPVCFPDDSGDLSALGGQQIPAVIILQPHTGGSHISDLDQTNQSALPDQDGIGMAGTHPVGDDTFDHDEDDEVDMAMMDNQDYAFDEEVEEMPQDRTPRSGKGVKLGHITQQFIKADSTGEDSPLTHDTKLAEDNELDAFGNDDQVSYNDAAPIAQQNYHDELSQIDPNEALELIGKIMSMQQMGLSNSNRQYTEDQLAQLPAVKLKQVAQEVTGTIQMDSEVDEAVDDSKPTKNKQKSHLDDLDDILNQPEAQPIANYDNSDDGEFNDTINGPATPSMPRASAADTRARTAAINPSQNMRDMMNRISPDAGGDEPEFYDEPIEQDALVARTAQDVPAVISSAMRTTGMQVPEWHTVNNLPGYQQQHVRGMGRKIFGMFTRTPLEQIQTIANVENQGPNTNAELNAVGNWLMQNAEDLGEVKVSHGLKIPGYNPKVKEYRMNGVRFQVVVDQGGKYIYAYPDADAIMNTAQPVINTQNNQPRLREGKEMTIKLTISEAIKFDDIIREGLKLIKEEELEESSLSRLIGKQAGGQKLVQWLHRKHKLGNEADLQPQPFSERMMWKEFKRNPDNFVIVSAAGGVAGIKPYEKMIRDRIAAAQKKGKDYDPGGDATLQYQVIAFTDDGQQIDPALLQPARQPGEEREVDPTVMKARMGKISGKDTQNPDNVFNLLSQQFGALRTVYLAGGAIERDKIGKRAELNKPAEDLPEAEALSKLFSKVRPVLKQLANEALSPLMRARANAAANDNDDQVEKLTARIKKIKEFLVQIDTTKDVNIVSSSFGPALRTALATAAEAPTYSPEYEQYLSAAARGSAAALKPVLDALRDEFFAKLR